MIIPYVPENLLELNSDIVPYFKNGIVVIDNVYKNYDALYEILNNIAVARWKHSDGGKNFLDYYDCRTVLPAPFVDSKNLEIVVLLKKLILEHYNLYVELENDILDFNYYKNIKKDVPNNMQHFPHMEQSFNCCIYLDKISSGGTALYETNEEIYNNEKVNLLYDISKLAVNLIPAKTNRLVIFPGWSYHGGFIQDHNSYIDNWRITQLMFFSKK